MLRPLILFPSLFVGIIAHELLHGLGYVIFGRLPWSAVRVGVKLKSMAAYAYTDSHVTAASYKGLAPYPHLFSVSSQFASALQLVWVG
jgi:hypothetical protein